MANEMRLPWSVEELLGNYTIFDCDNGIITTQIPEPIARLIVASVNVCKDHSLADLIDCSRVFLSLDDMSHDAIRDAIHEDIRKAGWRFCIDHLVKPEHECPICRNNTLIADLAECYRATGADPDGDEDWRLAKYATKQVWSTRHEHEGECANYDAQITTLTAENAILLDDLERAEYRSGALQVENASLRKALETAEFHMSGRAAQVAQCQRFPAALEEIQKALAAKGGS